MSSKLQLTTLAVLVSAALPAQAALYKVVEVDSGLRDSEVSEKTEYYGTAIQPSGNAISCFDSSATGCEDYKLAGETRNRPEGFSYREEVPFAMDHSFGYIDDNYDGFENYCYNQLGYSTCESWADSQYNEGWYIEAYGSNSKNSIAFVEGTGEIEPTAINSVVNSFSKASGAVSTIGNFSSSSKRNEVFSDVANADILTKPQSRAWASDGTYVVGSTSTKSGVGDNKYDYSSSPAIWDGSNLVSVARAGGSEKDGDYYSQGSMRDFYIDTLNNRTYGVGYNNYNDQHMNATIFLGTLSNPISAAWSSIPVNGTQVDYGEDGRYTNSVVTNINTNLIAVGSAKLAQADSGAKANRLFVVPNAASPSASFLSGDIFFNGAGGQMGGINNFNEIVGRVDVENHREYDGKQRRQRAFIYPYGTVAQGSVQERKDIFNNRAWIIDDLTNDGKVSGTTDNNNQFRIYDASDINDAGVISATALKCAGGYDSVARDSYCGNGSTDETVVAVKLVPIAGADASAIQARPFENSTIERQGGSLGFGAMTLLGLFGFMRKRSK